MLSKKPCTRFAATPITLITSSTNFTVANIPIAIPLIPISIALKNPLKSFSALNNSLNTPTIVFNAGNNASVSCILNPSNLIANTAIWSLKNYAFCANSSDTA